MSSPITKIESERFRNRFWSRVNKSGPIPDHRPELGECWEWTGSLNEHGYGGVRIENHLFKSHRMAWLLEHGEMPKLHVLHACDNPKCVRPNHLFLGTQKDNQQDMRKKGRHRNKTFSGEKNGFAKLKTCEVEEIRRLYATGKFTQSLIGAMFMCARSHVGNIISGRQRVNG